MSGLPQAKAVSIVPSNGLQPSQTVSLPTSLPVRLVRQTTVMALASRSGCARLRLAGRPISAFARLAESTHGKECPIWLDTLLQVFSRCGRSGQWRGDELVDTLFAAPVDALSGGVETVEVDVSSLDQSRRRVNEELLHGQHRTLGLGEPAMTCGGVCSSVGTVRRRDRPGVPPGGVRRGQRPAAGSGEVVTARGVVDHYRRRSVNR
jgi:hypothetical protein